MKEGYGDLRKRFGLPSFSKLEREFSISQSEGDVYTVKGIIKSVLEVFSDYLRLLEDLLHPDAGRLATILESSVFSDEDRRDYYVLYRRMMRLFREAQLKLLVSSESDQAVFLNYLVDEWFSLKSDLSGLLAKTVDFWSGDDVGSVDLGYLG